MRYSKLSTINFFHTYFSDAMFRRLQIRPTPQTDRMMKSYGLLLKEVGGTYVLLAREEGQRRNLIYELKDALHLSFYVFCDDQWLLNYSDLDLEHMHQGYLLRNVSKGTSLHLGDSISDQEKVVLVHNYGTLSGYLDDATPVSAYDMEKQIFSGTYFDFRKSYPMSDLCELGYFELRSDQLEAPLKCYAVAPTAQRLFGVMALNLDAKLLKDEDDFSYKATIASKAVVWRYLLVNREPLVYKDFKLYSGKTVLSLKEEYVTELGNGENAYLLETTEPITMAERYEHFYELEFVKQDPKTGQVAAKKRIGLPVPDITKVKISKSERGYKAYSDMYIYL